jgi:hypothetical protein
MNYRLGNRHTVILMSVRPGAPYADRVEDEGRILVYEGHDMPKRKDGPDPKSVDQPTHSPGGRLTQMDASWNQLADTNEVNEPELKSVRQNPAWDLGLLRIV